LLSTNLDFSNTHLSSLTPLLLTPLLFCHFLNSSCALGFVSGEKSNGRAELHRNTDNGACTDYQCEDVSSSLIVIEARSAEMTMGLGTARPLIKVRAARLDQRLG